MYLIAKHFDQAPAGLRATPMINLQTALVRHHGRPAVLSRQPLINFPRLVEQANHPPRVHAADEVQAPGRDRQPLRQRPYLLLGQAPHGAGWPCLRGCQPVQCRRMILPRIPSRELRTRALDVRDRAEPAAVPERAAPQAVEPLDMAGTGSIKLDNLAPGLCRALAH